MADPDVDMEELEARLYGQVHHAANEDEEPSSYRPPAAGAEPSGKRFDRYFENPTPQASFPSGNIQYQSPLNLNPNPSFFQSNHNLFNTPENFYKNFRLVPLSDLVLNPAVNNIVVFPPPPTQIFTQQNPPEWKMAKRMQNMMNKKERYLKRRREKRKRKKLEKKNMFREHYMMQPPQRTGLLESNSNEIEMKMSERSDEVICLSESDSSDCEAIHSEKDESVVILSSDDESKICEQSVAEVKCENSNANVKVNINNDAKPQRAVETDIDKKSKPEPSDVASTEDDEVIFVEPAGRQEVIVIDCEDSQTFPVKKATVVSREMIIQERRELLDTPESTNDFLDSTLTLNKNNEDDLNSTEQRADLDTCETESSCSTNDCETPSRSAIFNERVFDSPSKGVSELNFESFTNYIATKATPNRIPSILTSKKTAAALRADKSNNSRVNSSDSSSESDYEDSKSVYVEKRNRVEKKPSESAQNKKDPPLPNLSPITSEEELNLTDLTSDKSKFPQKKEKTSKSSRNKKAPLANLSLITSDEELDLADLSSGKSKSSQKKEEKSKSSRNKKAPLPNLSPITSDEELNITDSKSLQKKEKKSKSSRNKKAPLPNLSPITSDEELDITDSKSSQKKQKTSKSSPSQQSVEQPVKQARAEKRKSDTRKSPEPSKKPRENSKADLVQQETMEGSDSESSEDSYSMESPEPSKKSRQNKEKPSADLTRQEAVGKSDFETIEDSDSMKSPKKPQQNVGNLPLDLIQVEIVGELDSEASESDSDVEIVPASNLDSRGSDLELLNIETGSSPINVPQEKTNTKIKRFSDYWTDDMKKFYFETWNDENFSVEEEQRKMTDDPKLWKIIARDRVNVNLQPKGPRCHRCREFGHKSHNCKKKMEPPKCILCGARGHLEARCPNKVCTSCGRRSLYSTTYCSRCADFRYALCKICLVRGHTTSNCTDLWRCYHLTCGRRSHYSTTSCSRCVNYRYARCKICLVRSHTSSYCTDLWRRYHLTIRDGPIIQPINTHMKAWKDQWCSGCACRGHLEHDCNYYNRTHPPTIPYIHSYNDIHDCNIASHGLEWQKKDNTEIAPGKVTDRHNKKHSSDEFLPLDSPFATQTRGGGENYPNNIRPLTSIPINLNSLQIYPYNQAIAPNVLQSNFYQQFPVYNPIRTPVGHQFVTSNTTGDSSPTQNAETMISHADAIVEDFADSLNNPDQRSHNSKKSNKEEVRLLRNQAFKLLQKDGAQFLKKLRKQTNLRICVENRKTNNRLRYVCMLEGQDNQIPQAKDALDRYFTSFSPGSSSKKIFFSKSLNIIQLKNNIQKLECPLRSWIETANVVYNELKFIERKLNIETKPKTKLKLENKVRRQYTILNAMILGKLKIADGPRHMSILKQWITKGDNETVTKSLSDSFTYIFKNEFHLNIDYSQTIKKFDNNKRLKMKFCKFVLSNTTSDSSPAQNAETMISHAENIVEDFGVASNNTGQQSQNSKKFNIEELCLTHKDASKLLQEDGAQFLKVLEKQSNVKITVDEQNGNNGLRYVCTFEGQDDQILQAKDAIDRYLNILYGGGSMKKKILFKNINKLKENIYLLENPLRPWTEIANSVYNKLKSIESKMNIEKNPMTKHQLQNRVKKQYTILNAMILGKLKIADGPKHMSILKQWTTEDNKTTMAKLYHSVFHSVIYIFKNESPLNINYQQVIKTFCNDERLQIKIHMKTILDSGISICRTQNWTDALNEHKDLFSLVIINNYSDESVSEFKSNFKLSIEPAKKRKKKKTRKNNEHSEKRYKRFLSMLV